MVMILELVLEFEVGDGFLFDGFMGDDDDDDDDDDLRKRNANVS